ncbi:unnamed protein product, partial [Pylaiella littoralis]
MADIADIRRRRLEALGTNSAAAARSQRSAAVERAASNAREEKQEKHEKHGKGGATTSLVEETQPVIPSEFECVLCLRLYHDPVSLPCGHTYCRGCLKRALANKSQCPMCRAACHGGAGGCGTNLAMVSIIKSQFGAQYEGRRIEAEQDAMVEAEARRRAHTIGESVTPAPDGSVSMPVCLLDVIFFPHQPVTLYLFEPRYITLVNRCLSSTRRFAVFQDHTPSTGACGAVLEISDARMMNGGQYLVMCRGVGRCTSATEFEVEEGTDGLRYARVSPFEDDDEAITEPTEGRRNIRRRTADEVLGPELKDLADRTAVVVSDCVARLSTRQRVSLVRRCGEPPKVRNSSLASYRKLSFWLPSALSLAGGGASSGTTAAAAGRDDRERRAAMFRSRSLRQRLSEACQAVMQSEAVKGSTSSRRERGLRRLFSSSGSGAGMYTTRPPPGPTFRALFCHNPETSNRWRTQTPTSRPTRGELTEDVSRHHCRCGFWTLVVVDLIRALKIGARDHVAYFCDLQQEMRNVASRQPSSLGIFMSRRFRSTIRARLFQK